MKILIGAAAGWIAFSAYDQTVYGGRLTASVLQLARGVLYSLGV